MTFDVDNSYTSISGAQDRLAISNSWGNFAIDEYCIHIALISITYDT